MREIDIADPRFEKIWSAVNDARRLLAERKDAKGPPEKEIVLVNRLAEGIWLAELWNPSSTVGEVQRATNRILGKGGWADSVPRKFLGLIALELKGTHADDEHFRMAVTATEKVHRYITVQGAEANVRIYRSLKKGEVPPDMSKLEFLERLKSGETFVAIQGTEVLRCEKCAGFGRVTSTDGRHRDADGKMKCPACNGVGKATVPSVWEIVW